MKLTIQPWRKEGIQFRSKQTSETLNSSFITLLMGPSASGKSSLLEQLVLNQNFYGGAFDMVVFVGKSQYGEIQLSQDNNLPDADPIIIQMYLDKLNSKELPPNYNLLIVLDDVMAQIRSDRDNLWKPLFLNRRHLIKDGTVSYIITCQKFTLIPTWLRCGVTQSYIFKNNLKQLTSYAKQFVPPQIMKQFTSMCIQLNPHAFIYHNSSKNKFYNQQFIQLFKKQCKLMFCTNGRCQQPKQQSFAQCLFPQDSSQKIEFKHEDTKDNKMEIQEQINTLMNPTMMNQQQLKDLILRKPCD